MLDLYIERYGKRLYGLCVTLCGSTFDADDLYQETWLQVCRKFNRYDPSRPFEAWLTRVCVNLYRDRLRRKKLEPVAEWFETNEEKDSVLESVSAPESDESGLHEAIDKLPEKLRTAVILYYFHDLDVARTASVLGVPSGTVKSRLSKARALLREMLSEEGIKDADL